MRVLVPHAKMRLERHLIINDQPTEPEVYEGELQMPDPSLAPTLAGLVGDGKAGVTASCSLSHKSFGTGGDVFVSVSLTCNQDENSIAAAVYHAKTFANYYAEQNLAELQQKLVAMGLLKAQP